MSRLRVAILPAVLAIVAVIVVDRPGSAGAAPRFTLRTLSAHASGRAVTATAAVTSSTRRTAASLGICVRSASGAVMDFPAKRTNVPLSAEPVSILRTKTFPPGRYRYYACVRTKTGHTEVAVGTAKTFTVSATAVTAARSLRKSSVHKSPTSSPTTSPTPNPSSSTSVPPPSSALSTGMPQGDLPGWQQIFSDDFSAPVSLGSFQQSSYAASRWFAYSGYADTSGHGIYDPAKVMSVSNGAADWYLHAEGGQPYVSALVPRVPSTGWGQMYGRYSVRFRSDEMPGYKIAFLLWPDSDNWGEGEIDFPEASSLTSSDDIYANLYQRGNLSTGTPGKPVGFTTNVGVAGTGWHIATIEWSPGKIMYALDGKTLGTTTTGVPNTSMHMVLQVETSISNQAPVPSVAGHLQVDWVTMYRYAP